jgi:hypothetical protein
MDNLRQMERESRLAKICQISQKIKIKREIIFRDQDNNLREALQTLVVLLATGRRKNPPGQRKEA